VGSAPDAKPGVLSYADLARAPGLADSLACEGTHKRAEVVLTELD